MNLCPRFTIWSVLALFSLIEIIVFGLEIYLGGVSNESFIAANNSILDKMGQKVGLNLLIFGILGSICHEIQV